MVDSWLLGWYCWRVNEKDEHYNKLYRRYKKAVYKRIRFICRLTSLPLPGNPARWEEVDFQPVPGVDEILGGTDQDRPAAASTPSHHSEMIQLSRSGLGHSDLNDNHEEVIVEQPATTEPDPVRPNVLHTGFIVDKPKTTAPPSSQPKTFNCTENLITF